MKIAIVGWGLEAKSAYKFFGPEHEYLIVNESAQSDLPLPSETMQIQYLEKAAPIGVPGQIEDLSYLDGIEDCDKIVYQPTAWFNLQKKFGDNESFWKKATTVYDIFFENCPTKNITGVTGSKGKGTTSTLIAKMLEANGKKVHLGGNIGTPVLDMLPSISAGDWVVWEMANFQLKAAHYSPHIGICLMITEEHQDWHPDMADYIAAKANIFKYQTENDIAIYKAGDKHAEEIAGGSKGNKIPFWLSPGAYVRDEGMVVMGTDPETEIIKTNELKLIGKHNWENVCAAITAVWQVSPEVEPIQSVLKSFSGLEHRLEFVREIDGVDYYDDSFGTTPETAIVALHAFTQPAVLILGGWDKGLDYSQLVKAVAHRDRVRHVITIGKIGPKIASDLRANGFDAVTEGLEKMSDIVAEARRVAQAGDVILLSCGTSSFGLFHDYKDRGNQFKQVVSELTA